MAGLLSVSVLAALSAGTPVGASTLSQPQVAKHYLGGVSGTTITLEGPNQWTQSGSNFGAPWSQVVNEFKKVTGVTVRTDVLPLSTFFSVESTQLAAGTAPDLVFNQATYQPYMVVPLNSYLNKPNPFVPGNKSWLSEFNPSAFSAKVASVLDPKGNFDWVPFNLVGIAMYYNETAFKKAGITAPIGTFSQLISDCGALEEGWLYADGNGQLRYRHGFPVPPHPRPVGRKAVQFAQSLQRGWETGNFAPADIGRPYVGDRNWKVLSDQPLRAREHRVAEAAVR